MKISWHINLFETYTRFRNIDEEVHVHMCTSTTMETIQSCTIIVSVIVSVSQIKNSRVLLFLTKASSW